MQSLGIKSDSLGWRFLLGFVHNEAPIKASLKGKEREKENMQWQRILHALQEPAREDLKIVLLLPRETKQRFNIATLASHILLIDPEEINAGNATPLRRVVTLTGLRGILRQ